MLPDSAMGIKSPQATRLGERIRLWRVKLRPGFVFDYAVAGGGNPEGSGQAAGWGGRKCLSPGIAVSPEFIS